MIRVLSATPFRFVALTLAVLMSANSAAIAAPVSKTTSEGAYASASGYDVSGCLWFYVDVSRTGTKAASQTWLYYDLYDVCAQQRVGSGWGNIPDTSFRVSNKTVVLKLTVATTSSFYTEGSTGAIALTLTPSGLYKQTYSGHSTEAYLDRVIRSHGSWSYVSAQISGSILGTTVATLSGGVGESRGREMTIDRSSK